MNENGRHMLTQIRDILILNTSSLQDLGLYGGKIGVSIFLAHYARFSSQNIYLDLVYSLIEETFEEIYETFSYNLEIGLSGIGWGINYLLYHQFLSGDANNVLMDIDRVLMRYDVRRMEDLSLDKGLGGIVYYVYSRLVTQGGKEQVFDHLFLSDLRQIVKEKSNVWYNLPDKDLFLKFIHFVSKKPTKEHICMLPDFLKGKKVILTDNLSKMPLGLKNGLAGYGLNLMKI